MIRLEIDNQVVALSPGVMFDFYEYNSIFDTVRNRGTFTYDIDIDLNEGNNAKLYKHISRINGSSVFTNRTAALFVSGKRILYGKEVLLEINGAKVKIQIVCGNSEANYGSGETKIAELDLGMVPEYTAEIAIQTINAEPLSVDAVCTPVMFERNALPYVTYNVERKVISQSVNFAEYNDITSGSGSYHQDTKFIGQPYLIIVIERVLQAMGWNVVYDVLREMEYAKRLIVIHAYETREIAKMIPNWKVSEFLEQVQRMFNVIIVHHEENKTVEIFNREIFYDNLTEEIYIDIDDIIYDETSPSRKYEGSDEFVYGYESVKYDLPSETYGYRADISDDLLKIIAVQEFEKASDFNGPNSEYRQEDFYNKPVFLKDLSNNTKWMLTLGTKGYIPYIFRRVDYFAHVKKDDFVKGEDTETILKIVPAETFMMAMSVRSDGQYINGGAVIPFAINGGLVEKDLTTSKDYGLNQWVEGNAPKAKDTSSEKIFVAQYLGRTTLAPLPRSSGDVAPEDTVGTKYPQVYTHRFMNCYYYYGPVGDWGTGWRDYMMDALWDKATMEEDITFDLTTRVATTYKNSFKVNDKEVHSIAFRSKSKYNVRSIFNIAGRRFVCVSMKYQVQNGKLSQKVIGTFLPIK